MLIEVIGCTGAGKSTLCRRAVDRLRADGLDARLLHTGAARFDLVALPGFVALLGRRPGLAAFAARVLLRDADSPLAALNLFRHFARKMGMAARLARRRAPGPLVWEEGTLHAAHNLFVHVRRPPRRAEIERFARAVPKPDLVVYVRASVDTLLARTLARGHRRAGASIARARAFTAHAWETFEILAATDGVRERVLAVDNDVDGEGALARLGAELADRLAAALGARLARDPRRATA